MKIIIVTLVLTIHVIVSKYPDNKRPEYIYNFTALDFWEAPENYTEYGRKHAFPSTIRISPQGDLFVSVPRHIFKNETIESTIPGTINIIRDKILYPWPSSEENNYYGGRIHSVVGFEIDLQGRVWLLNYNNNRSSNLLIYDKDGKYLYEYNLTEVTIHRYHESYLTNILLDLNSGFAYISDTGNLYNNSMATNDHEIQYAKTKSNIIILNLHKSDLAIKILQKDNSTKPILDPPNLPDTNNKALHVKNIGIYGIALTCDKKHLYYSPLKSKQMYSIPTYKLHDEHAIRGIDEIKNYTKWVEGFEMTSSARGILYYTSITNNSINVNFYEKDISFTITRKVGNNISDPETINEYPVSMAFNGTTGDLFYLVNRHNIFLNQNLTSVIDDSQNNFHIMKVYVNDRSYLYPCNVFYYMPNHFWVFIVVFSLGLSYCLINIIKSVGVIDKNERNLIKATEDLISLEH